MTWTGSDVPVQLCQGDRKRPGRSTSPHKIKSIQLTAWSRIRNDCGLGDVKDDLTPASTYPNVHPHLLSKV